MKSGIKSLQVKTLVLEGGLYFIYQLDEPYLKIYQAKKYISDTA